MSTLRVVPLDLDHKSIEGIVPVFIVGPPRCGTSWAQSTIASHPDAVVSGETNVYNETCWPLMAALSDFVNRRATRLPAIEGRTPGIPAFTLSDARPLLRRCVERVFLTYLADVGRLDANRPKIVGDKSPGHTRHVGMLAEIFPEAKFVLCTRDVRDASVSAWRHLREFRQLDMFGPARTLAEGAEIYARHHWAELVRFARTPGARIGPDRFIELPFEEHHTDPVASVRRIVQFLGLNDSEEIIESMVAANTFERLTGGRSRGEESNDTVFRRGLVGEWREHFSDAYADHLVREAEARLALGDTVVDNSYRLEWSGGPTGPAPATASSDSGVAAALD